VTDGQTDGRTDRQNYDSQDHASIARTVKTHDVNSKVLIRFATRSTANLTHMDHVQMISTVQSPATEPVITELLSLVLLVGIAVCAVDRLDVLTQRTGVRVTFVTATYLADIRLLHKCTHHMHIHTYMYTHAHLINCHFVDESRLSG